MNSRKDQVIFVEQRDASFITCGIRWVERQLCQKPLPARVAGGDLRKLHEVGLADGGILVDAIQVWCVPPADEVEFRGPPRRPTPHQSEQVLSYQAGSFILFLLSSCHDLSHSAVDASSSFEKALGGVS
jgi:hypothetical protein